MRVAAHGVRGAGECSENAVTVAPGARHTMGMTVRVEGA